MQRYVVSTELIFEKETYRLIIELKENTEFAAWGAVIDGPAQTPAQRYALALRATTSVAAPFSKVVEFNDEISFLMRPRGYIDIEFKTPDEIREISLFDAYSLGLLHGGQGKAVSGPYVTAVMGAKKEFIRVVEKVADHTLGQLAKASGLKAPKKIKEKKK